MMTAIATSMFIAHALSKILVPKFQMIIIKILTTTLAQEHTMMIPQLLAITNCDGAGCWGSDGTRYNRGAGDTYFPSTGGVCQSVGGQMQCN